MYIYTAFFFFADSEFNSTESSMLDLIPRGLTFPIQAPMAPKSRMPNQPDHGSGSQLLSHSWFHTLLPHAPRSTECIEMQSVKS